MTTTAATATTPFVPPIAQPAGATGSDELGQAAFLRLMTAQVQSQDPFKPVDQTQMIAQMAQFSQVAGIAEMNSSLAAISDGIAAHTALLNDIVAALPVAATDTPVIVPTPPTA